MPTPLCDARVSDEEEAADVVVEDYPQKKGNVALNLIFVSIVRNQDTVPQNVPLHQTVVLATHDLEINEAVPRSAKLIPSQKKGWRSFRSKTKAE